MDQWLRELINSAVSGLRGLIDAVWERLAWVYNISVTLGYALRGAWNDALNRIRHFARNVNNFALQLSLTLYWIAWIRIPQEIGRLATDVTNWALQQINAARNFAQGLVDYAIRWTTDRINEVRSAISNVIHWATTRFNQIVDAVQKIARLVYQFLTDPNKLAEWALEAILAALWRHVDRNFDRIFMFIRERTIHYTLRFADRLESLLERLI